MMTVLFATRNGQRTLPLTLDAFCAIEDPPGGWKLVVVDNGSNDGSRDVLARYAERLPLTCVVEETPGKNAALNRGLDCIEGDLVILTDDDVVPAPDWLLRMRAAADERPEYALFSGPIIPRWETPPDPWITAWVPLGPTFTILDPSAPAGPAQSFRVFGPNMAVRTDVFAAGHRFDPGIGPRGRDYAMGSETEFVRRVLRAGFSAWFVPDAVVEHYIRAHQLQRSWILRRAYRFGRGQYRLAADAEPARVWLGVPRHLYRSLVTASLAVLGAFVRWDAERLFRARWHLAFTRGQIREARLVRTERKAVGHG